MGRDRRAVVNALPAPAERIGSESAVTFAVGVARETDSALRRKASTSRRSHSLVGGYGPNNKDTA
jgi:hypothetical protein